MAAAHRARRRGIRRRASAQGTADGHSSCSSMRCRSSFLRAQRASIASRDSSASLPAGDCRWPPAALPARDGSAASARSIPQSSTSAAGAAPPPDRPHQLRVLLVQALEERFRGARGGHRGQRPGDMQDAGRLEALEVVRLQAGEHRLRGRGVVQQRPDQSLLRGQQRRLGGADVGLHLRPARLALLAQLVPERALGHTGPGARPDPRIRP